MPAPPGPATLVLERAELTVPQFVRMFPREVGQVSFVYRVSATCDVCGRSFAEDLPRSCLSRASPPSCRNSRAALRELAMHFEKPEFRVVEHAEARRILRGVHGPTWPSS